MPGVPIAYLITFRCYGTWLHGDKRGSVDKHHNVFGTPFLLPNTKLETLHKGYQKHPSVTLDTHLRAVVRAAVEETCAFRHWELHALSVRTNHIHAVIGSHAPAEKILNALKANATRLMRLKNCWAFDHTPWSTGGSTLYLWTEKDLAKALNYVAECQ